MTSSIIELVFAAAIAVATWNAVCLLVRYIRLRVDELTTAANLLDSYEERIDYVLSDPALPESIRALLCQFDDSIGNPWMAKALVTRVFSRRGLASVATSTDEDRPMNDDLTFLAKHRPDLSRDFIDLVASGFAYTMMKWPFAARVFRLMLVDIKRDAITPAKTLIDGVRHDHFDPGPGVIASA